MVARSAPGSSSVAQVVLIGPIRSRTAAPPPAADPDVPVRPAAVAASSAPSAPSSFIATTRILLFPAACPGGRNRVAGSILAVRRCPDLLVRDGPGRRS